MVPGTTTAVFAYNGQVPGPTLEFREGDHVVIHFRNHLPEATTIHWHGLHIPAAQDGSPLLVGNNNAIVRVSAEIETEATTLMVGVGFGTLNLNRIWLEVFADNGRMQMASCFLPDEHNRTLSVFSVKGSAKLRRLSVWPLRSAWTCN